MHETGYLWALPFTKKPTVSAERPSGGNAGCPLGRLAARPVRWANALGEAIAAALLRRHLRRLLRQFDDRMLDDIGLSRIDVADIVRGKPHGRSPPPSGGRCAG